MEPPYYTGPMGIEGVHRYTLLSTLRPWWATFPHLPANDRPVDLARTGLMVGGTLACGLVLLVAGLATGRRFPTTALQPGRRGAIAPAALGGNAKAM
jgi:hypothetical protein